MNSTKQLFEEHCQKLDFLAGRAFAAIIVFGCYNLVIAFFNLPKIEDFEYYLLISSMLVAFGVMIEATIGNDGFIHKIINSNVAIIENELAFVYAPLLLGGASLMLADKLNLSSFQIAKHALLPAIIIYSAVLFENYYQRKQHLSTLELQQPFYLKILNVLIIICASLILGGAIYYFVQMVIELYNQKAMILFIILVLSCYILTIFYQGLLPNEASTPKYHYYLPILLLFWLHVVENIAPHIAILWSLAFFAIIIITSDALQSSFAQRKRLKQPKVASELYGGVMKLHHCCVYALATILFHAYYGIIIWAILQIVASLSAALSLDWATQPELVKILFGVALLMIIPHRTPVFWRYYLAIKLVDVLIIKLAIPPLMLYLVMFYVVVATVILRKFWQQKQWHSEYWLILIMPSLILLNNDLILLKNVPFEYMLVLALNVSIGTICLLSSLHQFLLSPNSRFENIVLLFAAIILLLPNSVIGFFAYSSLQALPQNMQLAAKYIVYFPILCMVMIICVRQRMREQAN